MNKHLPGFRAEASLKVKNAGYVGGPIVGAGIWRVAPQMQIQGGLGSFGSQCSAMCRCCARGNRFCCAHCRWCSGPIGYAPSL